jgi:hypothetical protein
MNLKLSERYLKKRKRSLNGKKIELFLRKFTLWAKASKNPKNIYYFFNMHSGDPLGFAIKFKNSTTCDSQMGHIIF